MLFFSPTQYNGVIFELIALSSLFFIVFSVSKLYCLLSVWPINTYSTFNDFNCSPFISPVLFFTSNSLISWEPNIYFPFLNF